MALDLKPVPGGRRHSFRVALRMARRDIRRHKGRSLLIILLIMLPVAGMTGAATLLESTQETNAERVQYQLGKTQARLRAMNMPNSGFVQDPVLDANNAAATKGSNPDPDFKPRSPKDAVPSGYAVLTESMPALTAKVGAANVPIMSNAVDALNPAFAGKFTLLAGRAPAGPDEVVVSPGLLDRFSLHLGDEITTSAGTFTVVGTLRDASLSDDNAVLFLKPGQGQIPQEEAARAGTFYYLVGDEPLTWAQIRKLNAVGVAALSRHVLLNPPLPSELGLDGAQNNGATREWSLYLTGGMIGALALLEVGLLAGAAFAVGAKGQVRELALLAASGSEAPTIRAVVTAGGLWLGSVAVVVGAFLGLAGVAALVFWAKQQGSAQLPGFHPDVLLTVMAMATGLLACALAALVPARQVAKQALLGALKSGRAPSVAGPWPGRIGVALLGLAMLALLTGAYLGLAGDDLDVQMSWTALVAPLLIGGAVLMVVALVLLTGSLVSLLTSRTAWLPLPLRMAARDSARNASRTVPAVAAVLAAATLASAIMVFTASQQEEARRTHYWMALKNQALVSMDDGSVGGVRVAEMAGRSPDVKPVEDAVQGALGTVQWTQVLHVPLPANCMLANPAESPAGTNESVGPAAGNCYQYELGRPEANVCPRTDKGYVKDPGDWRCQDSQYGMPGPIIIGGAAEIRAVFGREPHQGSLDVLAAGGIVTSSTTFVSDGQATIKTVDIRQQGPVGPMGTTFATVNEKILPAAVETAEVPVAYSGVISPEAASRLGIKAVAASLLIQLAETPDAPDKDQASAALAELSGEVRFGFSVEEGPNPGASALLWLIAALSALITLSAAAITTGLALADAKSDHMTLAGVGAPPRIRKALAGAQSLMTAGLGTLLGVVAGAVPASLAVTAIRMYGALEFPWFQLLALIVAVPLTGAAFAWLVTRAQLPMSRRSIAP